MKIITRTSPKPPTRYLVSIAINIAVSMIISLNISKL